MASKSECRNLRSTRKKQSLGLAIERHQSAREGRMSSTAHPWGTASELRRADRGGAKRKQSGVRPAARCGRRGQARTRTPGFLIALPNEFLRQVMAPANLGQAIRSCWRCHRAREHDSGQFLSTAKPLYRASVSAHIRRPSAATARAAPRPGCTMQICHHQHCARILAMPADNFAPRHKINLIMHSDHRPRTGRAKSVVGREMGHLHTVGFHRFPQGFPVIDHAGPGAAVRQVRTPTPFGTDASSNGRRVLA